MQHASFSAGCFWGVEHFFQKAFGGKGVSELQVGYQGGAKANPTYDEVDSGTTGHAETLYLLYDPAVVSYEALLNYFFRMHNPTTVNYQGNELGENVGTQYRSVVHYYTPEQKAAAEAAIARWNGGEPRLLEKLRAAHGADARVVTTVEQATEFWPAEAEHQHYLARVPDGYCIHRIYIADDAE